MKRATSGELYDELDPLYRAIWGHSLHHGLWTDRRQSPEEARQNLVELILAELQPHGMVADIGCGYGELARQLSARFGCRVIASTNSKIQAARIPAHPLLTVVTGDWLDHSPAPCSLDGALALESLSHFPSFEEFFHHLHPALKPGGRVAVADWFSETGRRPLLRGLASLGRLPSWRSAGLLREAAQKNGFRVLRSRDLSRQAAPTWSRLFFRSLFLPFRHPSLFPRLLVQSCRHPSLSVTFPLLRLLFETGDLEYQLVSFQK